jgi:hypothetical protein
MKTSLTRTWVIEMVIDFGVAVIHCRQEGSFLFYLGSPVQLVSIQKILGLGWWSLGSGVATAHSQCDGNGMIDGMLDQRLPWCYKDS